MNSSSRLPAKSGRGAPLEDYIRRNWNGRANGSSPELYYGVRPCGDVEDDGSQIYEVADYVRALYLRPSPTRSSSGRVSTPSSTVDS